MATAEQAIAILEGLSGRPVSAKTIGPSRDLSYSTMEAWLSSPRLPPDGDTKRMRAFTLGYLAISGGVIDPTGIALDNGRFLRPDKDVMKWALSRCILEWQNDGGPDDRPVVHLSETGRRFFSGGGLPPITVGGTAT